MNLILIAIACSVVSSRSHADAMLAAHVNTVSYPTFTILPSEVQVTVRLRVVDVTDLVDFGAGLARDPEKDPPRLTDDAVRARAERIEALIVPSIHVESDGIELRAVSEGFELVDGGKQAQVRARFESAVPLGKLRIRYEPFAAHDPQHRGLGVVRLGATERPVVFRAREAFEIDARDASPPSAWQTVAQYLRLGVDHIATGYDHLLFLLALLLAARGLREALLVVTGFTIAHSTTLVAASLRWVTLPSGIVEPAIALSIVIVALDNLRRPSARVRFAVTTAFGFVHGLGFAGFVNEVGLPAGETAIALASFNAGVEAGQAIAVCLAFPLLAWWRDRAPAAYDRVALRGGSVAVAAAGAVWFAVRIANAIR